MAAGQSPGKLAICSLVRLITVRVPDGDRQAIADPVITTVQGHENRPAIYRCAKIEIRQKSAKKSVDRRTIYKACDVPLSLFTLHLWHSFLLFTLSLSLLVYIDVRHIIRSVALT